MMLAPGGDLVEIVARGDGGAGQQQQDLSQRKDDPPGLAIVRKPRKMLQEQSHPRPRNSSSSAKKSKGLFIRRLQRIEAPTESHLRVKSKSSLTGR